MIKNKTVGLFGVGSMGFNHLRVLCEILEKSGNKVRFYDPRSVDEIFTGSPGGSRQVIDLAVSSPEALWDILDIAVIASPNETHMDLVIEGLKRKVPIFCEKPLCPSTAEMREIWSTMLHLGCSEPFDYPLQVGFIERFNPVVRELKNMDFTEMYTAEIDRLNSIPRERYRKEGVITDLFVHDFDLLGYLFNEKPHLLDSPHIIEEGGIPVRLRTDLALFSEAFSGRVVVRTSWIDLKKERLFKVFEPSRVVVADLQKRTLEVCNRETRVVRHREFYGEPLRSELEAFFSWIETGQKPPELQYDTWGWNAVKAAEELNERAKG